ncbi:GNAT family N-acetyltransferase [Streptomyces sp. NPDC093223]|uniref:GNAT family N-acetyltransferase n=1 Tax=Streptomyces sp. NPDC093223 TaxID=3366033 RepID=UPI00381800D3
MDLRIEAESWLAAAGIDQWRDPATRGPALEKWKRDISSGRTWMVRNGNSTLGTITLAPPDMDFWAESDAPDDAVYVAKLITSRAAKGMNLGARLLDWAGRQAVSRGKSWVRLDCWRTNRALQEFYLREGFAHVRTEAPSHRLSGWLAQRPAAIVRHPSVPLPERMSAMT